MNEKEIIKYTKYYSEVTLFDKLKTSAKKIGRKLLCYVLTLYYALLEGDLTIKEKGMIVASLGYFILPVDIIPDMMLPAGYSDDLALLTYVFMKLKGAITPEIKLKAKIKIGEYLGDLEL